MSIYLFCMVLPFYTNQLNPGDKSALLFLNGNECHPLEELLMALKLADIVIHSLSKHLMLSFIYGQKSV